MNILEACKLYGVSPFSLVSTLPDLDAAANLNGRITPHAIETRKKSKSRILRAVPGKNGLFYLLQESFVFPDGSRARRNQVFNIFGTIVGGRAVTFTNSTEADHAYHQLHAWIDDDINAMSIERSLRERIQADMIRLNEILEGLEKL